MFSAADFEQSIFHNNADFEHLACQLFKYQYENNELYGAYCKSIGISSGEIHSTRDIPFLPIGFFKTHEVITGKFVPQIIFESSGTTGVVPSRHSVKDVSLYKKSFQKAFELFYGKVEGLTVIGLLPSYLERGHSSLVYMVNDLIEQSGNPDSGFYLNDYEQLFYKLRELEARNKSVLLVGVTFALLDFAEKYQMSLHNTIIMETGGMKGRREEWTRSQVHAFLSEKLKVETIHSEYGMTELMSQAYSRGKGIFRCPPWMKVVLRNEQDPLQVLPDPGRNENKQGIINIIDLANIHSCAFIATDDLGKLYPDGSFEVLGRIDNSDLRGCSLLVR